MTGKPLYQLFKFHLEVEVCGLITFALDFIHVSWIKTLYNECFTVISEIDSLLFVLGVKLRGSWIVNRKKCYFICFQKLLYNCIFLVVNLQIDYNFS